MALEIPVSRNGPLPLSALLERLASTGLPTTIVMVDNVLQPLVAPVPSVWRDVRLRTPAGMVTLVQREGGIGVVVFGNASDTLRGVQRRVADALAEV